MNDHSAKIECSSLIRHFKDCMNAWLVGQNDLLSGTVDFIAVPADVDRASVLTNEELCKYNNDSDVDVVQTQRSLGDPHSKPSMAYHFLKDQPHV